MPKLKVLSGREVIQIFLYFGFEIANQKGSHIKLSRIKDDIKETLTIPNHKELDKGTLKAIIRQSSSYLSSDEIIKSFYND